jgi:hypothetical protein
MGPRPPLPAPRRPPKRIVGDSWLVSIKERACACLKLVFQAWRECTTFVAGSWERHDDPQRHAFLSIYTSVSNCLGRRGSCTPSHGSYACRRPAVFRTGSSRFPVRLKQDVGICRLEKADTLELGPGSALLKLSSQLHVKWLWLHCLAAAIVLSLLGRPVSPLGN